MSFLVYVKLLLLTYSFYIVGHRQPTVIQKPPNNNKTDVSIVHIFLKLSSWADKSLC